MTRYLTEVKFVFRPTKSLVSNKICAAQNDALQSVGGIV